MKHLFITSIVFFSMFCTICFAHEEPAKTLKEKQDKVKQKVNIYIAKIKSGIVWAFQVKEGVSTEKKFKSMIQEYDTKGNLSGISVFRNDTLIERVEYIYNPNSDMLTDIDFTPQGIIIEKTNHKYDKGGRVLSGESFDEKKIRTSRSEYKFNKAKKTIEFIKYNKSDSIEFRLLYKFAEDYDKCDYYEAIKVNAKGDQLSKVEKKINFQKQLIEKKVTSNEDKSSYTLEFQYNAKNNIQEITKKQKDGSVESKDVYSYEEKGNLYEIKSFDGKNNMKSNIRYTYEFYK